MSLQESVDDLYELFRNRSEWRFIAMLTEEAGEVQGAYNKMVDGNIRKPKTREDVVEELAQLTGCCFLAAKNLGLKTDEILSQADFFLQGKKKQIIDDRKQMVFGQENNPDS